MSTSVGNLSVELGISDAQLRAGLAQAVVASQQAGQKMKNNLNQVGGEGFKLPANGLLQLSRAADDLQYGLKGVVNNIEGIVTGFGGGAALAAGFTLTAIAVNTFGDDIADAAVKMMDGRSAMQRLTDQAQYASTIFGELRAKIELSTQELDKLSKYDANAGFGGWLRRQMGYDNNAMNESAAFQFATMSEQTMLDQRELSRRSTTFSKGMEFLDPVQDKERNARRAEAFTNLFDTDFKRQKLFGDLTGQLANDEFGGDFTRARQRAREILGQTALGLKEGFDIINKMTKNGLAKEDFRLSMEEAHKESKKAAEDAAKEYSKALDDQMNGLAKQFRERQKIEEQRDKIQGNIDELKLSQMRTEIIGGSDAFLRNFNAGTSEDPVVKAIDKQTEELSAVMERLKELN